MILWTPTGKVSDSVEKPRKNPLMTSWRSIYIAASIAFLQSFQYSMFAASLWNYSRSLNANLTQSTYGYIVGANSFAQAISAPLFGYWSDRIESVKLPLFIGLIFMTAGNFLYFAMPMFKNGSYLWLVLARTLTGIGFGNSALIRAYASQSSSSEDRSRALAWTTAGDTLGTTTGLLVQILFFPLGLEGFSFFGFPFTAYTTPALLACLINVFGFIIVSKFFVEDYTMLRIEKKELDNQTVSPCWLALGICVLTRSSQALLLSTNDVVGSPYISMMFGYSEKETLQYNILMMLIQSVIGLVIYFAYITLNLGKKLAIRTSIRLSLASFLLYHVLTFSYPFYSDYVELGNPAANSAAMSGEYGVCEVRRYSWCTTLTTFNPFLYYISYLVLIGGFFPIINIALTTLLSKVIGPRAQGTYQGLFQVAGCISKMSSPVMLGYAYDMAGPRLLWIIQESQTIFVFLLWIAFNGRMIDMSERIEKMERRQKVTRKEMSQKAVNVWTTNNHKTRNEFVNIK